MRIVVATRHLEFAGGVETHLQAVLPLLLAQGHSLAILHEHPQKAESANILPTLSTLPRICAGNRPIGAILQDVADFQPDLVYNHGLDSPALEAGLTRRFPSVLFAHNYYGICISGTRCHAGGSVTPCQRAFGPACLALYLPRHCGGSNPWTMLRLYRTESRRARTLAHYRAILVASRYVGDQYLRCGVDPRRIHIVPLFPPGILPDPAPPSPRPFSRKILFLGRITRLKGLDHLTRALPLAASSLGRPLELVIGGDGPERDTVVEQGRKDSLKIESLGWIDTAQRNRLMAEADLLAIPSVWPEPFGLVGVEAACAGLPSVGYASGGIPEWLIPGVSGELATATPPHPHDFAQAIVRALRDPTHWQRLREGAWRLAGTWNPENHLRRWSEVVTNLPHHHV